MHRYRFSASQPGTLNMSCKLLTLILVFLFGSSTLATEDATALPERYSQLGLEPLNELFDFKYRSFRDGDRQSIVVRTRGREIYLLVFNAPINPRNKVVDINSRRLRPGFTRARIDDAYVRIEKIYQLRDRAHELEVVKFLRAND